MRRQLPRTTTDKSFTTLQDAAGQDERIDPRLAGPLRAHSMATRDEMRMTRGSADGNAGPRAATLIGYTTPGDSGAGIFAWNDASTAADDEGVTTIAVAGVEVGRWKRIVSTAGVLLAIRVLTSGTSYTPTPGTKSAVIELWAGGGAGGGAAATGGATASCGGGGASGGYLRKRIASLGAGPFTIQIGAAGTGVSGGAGNAGTDTTFNDGTTTYTAKGGNGGQASAAVGVVTAASGGTKGGTSTNGDVNGAGAEGTNGLVMTTTSAAGGTGGGTAIGGGATGFIATAGFAGTGVAPAANTGAGGGGAAGNNAGAQTGGPGATGLIVVQEFG